VKQGEQVFAKSCATGSCHGSKGSAGGAPRLAARGFDEAYIANTVTRGLPGTSMPALGTSLSRADLVAVVAYVATLNGIANPNTGLGPPSAPAAHALSGEAARGRDLFSDSVRGFGTCSTCHEVNGIGTSVTMSIAKIPTDAAALRALATPGLYTVTLDGESMPALVLSKGSRSVVFYDLTMPPPVLHTVEPAAVTIAEGSGWKHVSLMGSYNDAELGAILTYLRTTE
jgi:mono/diheme cytochrome c family protein